MSKSPNKHNRIFAKGQPLDEELCNDIENNKVCSSFRFFKP